MGQRHRRPDGGVEPPGPGRLESDVPRGRLGPGHAPSRAMRLSKEIPDAAWYLFCYRLDRKQAEAWKR